jgi:hypothetical protein
MSVQESGHRVMRDDREFILTFARRCRDEHPSLLVLTDSAPIRERTDENYPSQ